nr:ubiquitin carboxyl-terminal hydrolase 9-like [Ipomoea batatas]
MTSKRRKSNRPTRRLPLQRQWVRRQTTIMMGNRVIGDYEGANFNEEFEPIMTIPDSMCTMMENGSIEFPCTPEEERRIIQELTNKAEFNLKEGDLVYVISTRWYTAWQRYTGQPVGAYTFDQPLELLRSLQEGLDYELVPKEAWEKLFEW